MQAKDRPTYHMLLTGHDHGSTHPAIYLKVEWARRIFQFFLSPQVGHQASIATATATHQQLPPDTSICLTKSLFVDDNLRKHFTPLKFNMDTPKTSIFSRSILFLGTTSLCIHVNFLGGYTLLLKGSAGCGVKIPSNEGVTHADCNANMYSGCNLQKFNMEPKNEGLPDSCPPKNKHWSFFSFHTNISGKYYSLLGNPVSNENLCKSCMIAVCMMPKDRPCKSTGYTCHSHRVNNIDGMS